MTFYRLAVEIFEKIKTIGPSKIFQLSNGSHLKYIKFDVVGEIVEAVHPCFVDTPRFRQGARIAEQGDLRHVIYGRLEGDATAVIVQARLISSIVL